VFTKNRQRLLKHDVARQFFDEVVRQADGLGLSPVGTGVASPPPGQNPTCAINASGSPEQIARAA
jgi:hypothetical protein